MRTITRIIDGHKFKISQTNGVWFLDEIEKSEITINGEVINNICNGSFDYCLSTLQGIKQSDDAFKFSMDGFIYE